MNASADPPRASVQELYRQTAAELCADHPEVETTRMFGSDGLKAAGKTFAMITRGRLVVKLPRDRVGQLVDAGVAERFDPGHGRLMKEWASLAPGDLGECSTLMRAALAFVTANAR